MRLRRTGNDVQTRTVASPSLQRDKESRLSAAIVLAFNAIEGHSGGCLEHQLGGILFLEVIDIERVYPILQQDVELRTAPLSHPAFLYLIWIWVAPPFFRLWCPRCFSRALSEK